MSHHTDVAGLTLHGATKAATAHSQEAAQRARRFVASMSVDAEDCGQLLDMLGLLPPVASPEQVCEQ